jgi:hypothetical protein
MNDKSNALNLAKLLMLHSETIEHNGIINRERWTDMVIESATELTVLHAENERLKAALGYDWDMLEACRASLREHMIEGNRLKTERDALLNLVRDELSHAEWLDEYLHPNGGERYQNWMLKIYLPVPFSESDKSPEAAFQRVIDAVIKGDKT